MKRSFTIIFWAILMIAMFLTAGCSAAASAVPAANGAAQASTVQPSASSLPAQTPTAKAPVTPLGSDWEAVLNIAISQPTNMAGFLNDQFGLTVGYSGEIHYSEDAGKTWPRAQNSSACRFCLDIVDRQLMWCGGNGNNVRVSHDGGKTWSAVEDIALGDLHSNISFVDDTTGWIATPYKLASTADGGKTWNMMKLPEGTNGIAAICLRTPKDGYLLSLDGLLFTTADGGTTWSKKDLGLADLKVSDVKKQPKLNKGTLALADISFPDEKNGSVVFIGLLPGDGYRVWNLTTADGGATWKSALVSKPSFTPSKLFLSKDGMYLTLSSNTNQTEVLKRK